jgi:hypothetical protein
MGRAITKEILDIKLVKVEKTFNNDKKPKYFYNLYLQGIEEPVILELEDTIDNSIVGSKIKYYLNESFEISEFELI